MSKKHIVILFLAIQVNVIAQWQNSSANSVGICITNSEQSNLKLISDNADGAIITWEDYRNANADIYAQRIDNLGNIVWVSNGLNICNNTSFQIQPNAISDGKGGAYIVWEDFRNAKKSIYIQRINSAGTSLFSLNGIRIANTITTQENPKLQLDNNGACIVIWQDSGATNNFDIKAQRIDSNGTLQWGANGTIVCNAFEAQINARLAINSLNETYFTWQDKRNGSDYDIYVQKFNLTGIAQYTANGNVVSSFIGTQANPKMNLVDNTGVFIVWQDKRTGSDFDIYAEYISSTGTKTFGTNNLLVCNAIRSQSAIDIIPNIANNELIITWKDARVANNNINIYAQKINKTGSVLWAVNGVGVATQTNNQLNANIISDGFGGAIISYQDSSNTKNWEIKAQQINSSGVIQWPAIGAVVCDTIKEQSEQKLILTNNGGSIHAWQDKRNGNFDIYAAKLFANGTLNKVQNITSSNNFIKLYPNPSNGMTMLDVTSLPAYINIYSIDGRMVYEKKLEKLQDNFILNNGFYFVHVKINNEIHILKLTVN